MPLRGGGHQRGLPDHWSAAGDCARDRGRLDQYDSLRWPLHRDHPGPFSGPSGGTAQDHLGNRGGGDRATN